MSAWQPTVESVDADGACIRVVAPAESPWFGGHFPGAPVLPAVAILSLVEHALGVFAARAGGPPLVVAGLRRVRFRHLVRPESTLRVTVHRAQTDRAFDFQVDADGTASCSGTCTV
jgi:3-hydroxymyristoyl/3-hydroxydecanoyl-(acyl carrier protein) dehydratase